eukprot:g40609.t1
MHVSSNTDSDAGTVNFDATPDQHIVVMPPPTITNHTTAAIVPSSTVTSAPPPKPEPLQKTPSGPAPGAPLTKYQLRWLWPFGAFLAFNGGFMNVIVYLIFHVNAANMTGNTTNMGVYIAYANINALRYFGAISLFVLGSMLSSLISGKSQKFRFSKRFGRVMALESVLISITAILLEIDLVKNVDQLSSKMAFEYWREISAGVCACANAVPYILSLALGLQNGMMCHLSGCVVRTTHVTGTLTDIGTELGEWIRSRYHGKKFNSWKLQLLSLMWVSFFLGGFCGAILSPMTHVTLLFFSAATQFAFAVMYALARRRHFFHKADINYQTHHQLKGVSKLSRRMDNVVFGASKTRKVGAAEDGNQYVVQPQTAPASDNDPDSDHEGETRWPAGCRTC